MGQQKTETFRSRDLRQARTVKLSGSGGKGRAAYGMELQKAVLNIEPPDADPHVRWCERRRLTAASYSIR